MNISLHIYAHASLRYILDSPFPTWVQALQIKVGKGEFRHWTSQRVNQFAKLLANDQGEI